MPAGQGGDPLVSIILPTYNRAATLPRALASVRAQTHTAWQLIVEDDGSTDETDAVLANWAALMPGLVVCSHPNIGPSASRNHGLTHAEGSLITFLDSDDEYLPEHLALRVAWMRAHPRTGMIHGGAHVIGDEAAQYVADARDPSQRIHIGECAVGGTFFCRADVLRASFGWPEGYAEDCRLLAELVRLTSVERVDFPTYLYHRDTGASRCDTALAG
jgi:glycosyltransferase involved in cell wall biosynthesis